MKLSELRDRLQDEFDSRETPIQWSTFMLGKVAQLEAREASARTIMQKFINKVDTGMARSTETYREMKEWLDD